MKPSKLGVYVAFPLIVPVLFASLQAHAGTTYAVLCGNERLEFVPQFQKGYAIKLREKTEGITALGGISTADRDDPRPVLGLDRYGVWIVENAGPAAENERAITRLRQQGRVTFAAPLYSSNGQTVAIIPEIVVRMVPGTEMEELEALCENTACRIRKRMEFTEQEYLLEVLGPDGEAVFAAAGQLSQAACVEWACPNTAFQPKLGDQVVPDCTVADQGVGIASAGDEANTSGVFPNDEYFPMQWHLYNTGQSGGTPGADIRAPEAWEITTGDPNIVVAVLDCGVDTSHPDLINNLVAGYDFIENDPSPDPIYPSPLPNDAHGTACAGLIGAQGNNSIGVTGVTWNCRVMPIRQAAQQYARPVTEDIGATALRWAAAHGADILSQSGGWDYPTPIIHSAIVDITKAGGIGRNGRGCVLMNSAANSNTSVQYSARYPEVIAVGATDHQDLRWGYSNYGPDLDVMAPGGPTPGSALVSGIWTTDIAGSPGGHWTTGDPAITDYLIFGGTSASTPIAAGVAALILSVEPNLTNDEVRHFLCRSAKDLGAPGRDDYYGWGRVDARAALDMVLAKRADLNIDWKVDEQDRAILLKAMETNDRSADIAPAAKRDGIVDAKDLELLTRYLGTVIPELGLIVHWKLDETEGRVAFDSAGTNNGTLIGNPTWQPTRGKLGGVLQLNGVDDYVSTAFVLDPAAGPFSVFAWVKGGAPGQVILAQDKGTDWLMAGAPDGGLATELKSSGRTGKALKSAASVTDGAWHRVGLVWDSSNRILYVDDIEVTRDTQTTLVGTYAGLYVGAGSTLAPGSFWSGLIDDVRIYDRAVKPQDTLSTRQDTQGLAIESPASPLHRSHPHILLATEWTNPSREARNKRATRGFWPAPGLWHHTAISD
jgi:subtilisin family serine protease